jgi:UDP-N-acetylmuramate dehydrogenase
MADASGAVVDLDPASLGLSYRNSGFTRGEITDRIVLGVDLRVAPGDPVALRRQVKEFDQQRRAAQPPGQNCGSVFKNPPTEHPSWWYVDQVGLRGHAIGGAQISEKHTNFIENIGGATANDVIALIDLARQRIRERFGIEMETEVQMAGEFA